MSSIETPIRHQPTKFIVVLLKWSLVDDPVAFFAISTVLARPKASCSYRKFKSGCRGETFFTPVNHSFNQHGMNVKESFQTL